MHHVKAGLAPPPAPPWVGRGLLVGWPVGRLRPGAWGWAGLSLGWGWPGLRLAWATPELGRG